MDTAPKVSASHGSKLWALRSQANLTRVELAQLASTTENTIYRAETGDRGLSAAMLRRIADALAMKLGRRVGSVLADLTEDEA